MACKREYCVQAVLIGELHFHCFDSNFYCKFRFYQKIPIRYICAEFLMLSGGISYFLDMAVIGQFSTRFCCDEVMIKTYMQLQFSNICNKNTMFDNASLKSEDWCTYKTFLNLSEMMQRLFYHVSQFSKILYAGYPIIQRCVALKRWKGGKISRWIVGDWKANFNYYFD